MNKLYPDVPEWVRITDMRPTPSQGNRATISGKVPWTEELEGIAVEMRDSGVKMALICQEIERLTGVRISVGGMRDYINKRAEARAEGL